MTMLFSVPPKPCQTSPGSQGCSGPEKLPWSWVFMWLELECKTQERNMRATSGSGIGEHKCHWLGQHKHPQQQQQQERRQRQGQLTGCAPFSPLKTGTPSLMKIMLLIYSWNFAALLHRAIEKVSTSGSVRCYTGFISPKTISANI